MSEPIKRDLPVFLHDGDVTIGSVREVIGDKLVIYIENAGDFTLSRDVVHDVHFNKVILDGQKLDERVRAAIGKAHASEDDEDHEPTDD